MGKSLLPLHLKGLTLIELMVTIAILGILAAIAIPSFRDTIDRTRLTGAADNLMTNIKLLQSEAVKTNQTVTITFSPGSNWSYASNTIPVISASSSDYRGTNLSSGTELTAATHVLSFDPRRNMVTPRAVDGAAPIILLTLQSELGQSLSVIASSNSTISLCSSTSLGRYPPC